MRPAANPAPQTKQPIQHCGLLLRAQYDKQVSYDEGGHWTVKRTIEPGATGYADLAVMPDGTILCLYEAVPALPGGSARHDEMLGRFNLEWLREGKDSLEGSPR